MTGLIIDSFAGGGGGSQMRVLDLFSGIGGFSLGLGRAGFATVRFCEIDAYCRAVLAKHWPGVPCAQDIKTAHFLEGEADVVCGGFPCQDISSAGMRAGLSGARSGLYRELVRAVRLVRPRWALLENVAALLVRGLGDVLGSLAEIGYDAEWHCIPAAAVGAPHRRDRIWIIADPAALFREEIERRKPDGNSASLGKMADAYGKLRRSGFRTTDEEKHRGDESSYSSRLPLAGFIADELANTGGKGLSVSEQESVCREGRREEGRTASERSWWTAEPDVGRVAYGVPCRVDRLRSLGNSVVPQIPEILGRAILAAASESEAA